MPYQLSFTNQPTLALFQKFATQRPQLDFCNYGDAKSYRQEVREITKDLHDFRELLRFASHRMSDLEILLKEYLLKNSGRLTLNDKGNLEYITGQYFPTEYRPACNRILANLIWKDYADEKQWHDKTAPQYADGTAVRHAITKNVSRRVAKLYFN